MSSVVTGGGRCGFVGYACSRAPIRAVMRHCSMCGKHSDGPVLAIVVLSTEAISWTTGEPAWHASSRHADRGFCPHCGSPFAMRTNTMSHRLSKFMLAVSTKQTGSKLQDHVWTSEQVPWLRIDDDLPRYPAERKRD